MSKPTGSNKENFERTRAHLLDIAAICFAKHGYANCSTTQIIEIAGSSRGSLYHHFRDKEIVFKAVYNQACEQIVQKIQQYPYKGVNATEDLIDGCVAYLQAFTDQKFVQILLIDGPHVLGMEYCRSKDAESAYKLLYEGVLEVLDDAKDVQVVADFLSGALDTYALRIAASVERENTFKHFSSAFRALASKLLKNHANYSTKIGS